MLENLGNTKDVSEFWQVRDELEHLLDDDMDMAAMHLSEKLAYQVAGQSSRFHIGKEARQSDEDRYRSIRPELAFRSTYKFWWVASSEFTVQVQVVATSAEWAILTYSHYTINYPRDMG